jgi:hypothetical protein
MSYSADEREAVLGRLLMDIVHGDLSDDTMEMVDEIDSADLGEPMGDLVRCVQSSNRNPDLRGPVTHFLMRELRGITLEQMEDHFPEPQELPAWQADDPLPDRVTPIIKDLVFEILRGRIRLETLTAIDDLGGLEDIPEPYRELLLIIQQSRDDGKELADSLLYNLSGIINDLKLLESRGNK